MPNMESTNYLLAEILQTLPISIKVGKHDKVDIDVSNVLERMKKHGTNIIHLDKPNRIRISIEILTSEDFSCKENNTAIRPGWFRVLIRYTETQN